MGDRRWWHGEACSEEDAWRAIACGDLDDNGRPRLTEEEEAGYRAHLEQLDAEEQQHERELRRAYADGMRGDALRAFAARTYPR